jgi:hypothetical protein
MPNRPRPRLTHLLPLLLALLGACSGEQVLSSMVSEEDDAYARAYLAAIERADTAALLRDVDPLLRDETTDAQFARMMAVFRDRRMVSAEVIGVQRNTVNGVPHVNLSYELRLTRGWAVANVATRVEGGKRLVEGASVSELDRPLREMNAFRLTGKPMGHYVVLAMAAVVPALMLVALFLLYRMDLKRRWAWALATVVGLGQFSFNWSTGDATFNPVNLQIFGSGWYRAGSVAPVVLAVSFPVAALWIIGLYLQRGRYVRQPAAPPG